MLRLKACRIGLTGVKNVVALLGLLPPPPPPLPLPPPGLSGLARLSIEVVPNVVFLSPLQLPLPPESTPCRSEEHTSELQSLMRISSAVFCLKKKNPQNIHNNNINKHE